MLNQVQVTRSVVKVRFRVNVVLAVYNLSLLTTKRLYECETSDRMEQRGTRIVKCSNYYYICKLYLMTIKPPQNISTTLCFPVNIDKVTGAFFFNPFKSTKQSLVFLKTKPTSPQYVL